MPDTILLKNGSLTDAEREAMRQPYPKPLPISLAPWTGYLRTSAHAGKSTSKRPAMAANVFVDAGFLVALLRRRDRRVWLGAGETTVERV